MLDPQFDQISFFLLARWPAGSLTRWLAGWLAAWLAGWLAPWLHFRTGQYNSLLQ